jgi:hypothetical protein
MFSAILVFAVLLMACVLLAAATANNIMHPGVPRDLEGDKGTERITPDEINLQ